MPLIEAQSKGFYKSLQSLDLDLPRLSYKKRHALMVVYLQKSRTRAVFQNGFLCRMRVVLQIKILQKNK